jgi:muramoyltetrapeptide carboxypeptidase
MIRVGIVAPGRRLNEASAQAIGDAVRASGLPLELVIHPQAHLEYGHFAGPDRARLEAFLSFANDPAIDAIWFARGGYGAARLLSGLTGKLTPVALNKVYLGYSDMGFLLAGLTRLGCKFCAHGPLVADIDRENGHSTALRALEFLARVDRAGLADGLALDRPNLAFNLTIVRSLLGTDWLPKALGDQGGAVLWLEDVAEYAYATDRSMFQLASSQWFRSGISGVRIGRFSHIPENDVPFPLTSPQSVAEWCETAGISVLGSADIGHDADNKIVPFGMLSAWQTAGLISSTR